MKRLALIITACALIGCASSPQRITPERAQRMLDALEGK
jgi:uncharacterized protein YcfL